MSIEIIEKPTHKCSVCGCVFAFDKEDIEEKKIKTTIYGVVSSPYLKCPMCGAYDIAFNNYLTKL